MVVVIVVVLVVVLVRRGSLSVLVVALDSARDSGSGIDRDLTHQHGARRRVQVAVDVDEAGWAAHPIQERRHRSIV